MNTNKVIGRKFQVGDKVICTVSSSFGNTKNREGVITNIQHDKNRNRAKYCVTLQGYNTLHGMVSPMNITGYSYEFKLKDSKVNVPEAQNIDKGCKFGLNQKVKILVGYHTGRLGIVTKITPTVHIQSKIEEYVYTVTDINGIFIGNYSENGLEKYEQPKSKNTMVELTLEQAKTMYKAGGSLKTLALSVYSENELNPRRPKDLKEFCELYGVGECSILDLIEPEQICLSRLLLMRKAWVGDWKAKWSDPFQKKWIIKTYVNKKGEMLFTVAEAKRTGLHAQLFAFPTEEMAIEFLNCFRNDLVKVERNFQ